MSSAFERLNSINVNGHTEKKNGLTYLSWAWAWAEVKKLYPDSTYTIYENKDGWNYHTDGRTCWVKTGVTVNGIEHIEYLPVMDFKNRSIPVDIVTSFDVNKAIQRSLTKAVARHGLGLYIYAGEDLPETDQTANALPADTTPPAEIQRISADDQDKLKQNAQYVYGEDWEKALGKLLGKANVGSVSDLTYPVYDRIKTQMKNDLKAKKGAA
jgi:hypothetical protein